MLSDMHSLKYSQLQTRLLEQELQANLARVYYMQAAQQHTYEYHAHAAHTLREHMRIIHGRVKALAPRGDVEVHDTKDEGTVKDTAPTSSISLVGAMMTGAISISDGQPLIPPQLPLPTNAEFEWDGVAGETFFFPRGLEENVRAHLREGLPSYLYVLTPQRVREYCASMSVAVGGAHGQCTSDGGGPTPDQLADTGAAILTLSSAILRALATVLEWSCTTADDRCPTYILSHLSALLHPVRIGLSAFLLCCASERSILSGALSAAEQELFDDGAAPLNTVMQRVHHLLSTRRSDGPVNDDGGDVLHVLCSASNTVSAASIPDPLNIPLLLEDVSCLTDTIAGVCAEYNFQKPI